MRHSAGSNAYEPTTLAVAHLDDLDIDVLVTIWQDGTGEVAYRPGTDLRRVTWSPPVALVNAP